MAKRVFQMYTYTPTATADGSALANGTYQGMEAGAATMLVQVSEIYIGGQAGASTPTIMQFARSGVVATTPSVPANPISSDGFMNSFGTALATSVTVYASAATGPLRSTAATNSRLNLSVNAFGGIVRWVAYPGEEWGIMGTAQAAGSMLSAFTGGTAGLLGSHIVYESS